MGMQEEIAELRRQIEDLTRSNSLRRSTIKNGTLELQDSNGVGRVYIGEFSVGGAGGQGSPGPRYGITIRDDTGGIVFEVANDGLNLPATPFTFVEAIGRPANQTYQDVNSASFVTTHDFIFPIALQQVVVTEVYISADAGTTGEVRLTNSVGGGASSTARTIPAASGAIYAFKWLHQQSLFTGPLQPAIQVRRTGGAGLLHVYAVNLSYLTSAPWEPAATNAG